MNAKELLGEMHPGRTIAEDVLKPLGMSVNALARQLHIPTTRLNEIVRSRRGISADTALRLARYLGTTPQFWLNLQSAYDLKVADGAKGSVIKKLVHPRKAA
ncbi:MAG TPA: HigA family addiction module antitoxin [Terriglobia bacterium]|nr:HigA family addiction module antitoxin [Terriglobia bacterium]